VSERNRETLNVLLDALNSRDLPRVIEPLAPDFYYDITRTESPLRGVYSRDQMPTLIEEFLGGWEHVCYSPDEVIDAGDNVVMRFTTHFRGRHGIELETQASWVVTFRDDVVTGICLYQEHADALQAAGVAGGRNVVARGVRRLRELVGAAK
jgi:ketosteroid isomerase-like protein